MVCVRVLLKATVDNLLLLMGFKNVIPLVKASHIRKAITTDVCGPLGGLLEAESWWVGHGWVYVGLW